MHVAPVVRETVELVATLGPLEIDELDALGGANSRASALLAVREGHLVLDGNGETVDATPVVRELVLDQLRRDRPDRVAQLLTAQADLRFESGARDCGLTAARALGDVTRLGPIIDRWGVDLAHGQFAGQMFEIALQLPLELADVLPGLALRFEDIGRLPIGTTPLDLPRTAEEAAAEFARNGDLRLRQALLPLATRRRLGRFDEAVTIVRAGTALAEASVYPWYGQKSRILPYWYLQAGITAQVAGDLAAARRHFLDAWSQRHRDHYGFVARAAAGKLALVHAFHGEHAQGAEWLARGLAEDRKPDLWVDGFVESNLATAKAIHAVDVLDPEAHRHLGAMPHPTQRGEQWVLFLWLHVRHALTSGDTARARRVLDDTMAAKRPALIAGGLAARLLPQIRADIHLAMGQANQALREVRDNQDVGDVGGAGRVLRARILLLADDPAAALAEAATVVRDESAGPRAVGEALLVLAAARHATGDRSGAVADARRACARVVDQDAVRSVATVPRTVLDDLAEDVPSLPSLLDILDRRGITDIYPKAVQVVSVTARERDLLRDLDSGLSLPEIAKANFVSVNTTRTHLASLRRKLDARSRGEVVAKARQLGLLGAD